MFVLRLPLVVAGEVGVEEREVSNVPLRSASGYFDISNHKVGPVVPKLISNPGKTSRYDLSVPVPLERGGS